MKKEIEHTHTTKNWIRICDICDEQIKRPNIINTCEICNVDYCEECEKMYRFIERDLEDVINLDEIIEHIYCKKCYEDFFLDRFFILLQSSEKQYDNAINQIYEMWNQIKVAVEKARIYKEAQELT